MTNETLEDHPGTVPVELTEDNSTGDVAVIPENQEEELESVSSSSTELADDIEALNAELNKITVHPPTIDVAQVFDPEEFPASYKDNLPKESLVLQYAENFRRQYVHLYRDRKPLLLHPVNECGTEKFVCTTVRPTQLEYGDLYDWDGAAEFVADYLNFETLEPPTDLPTRMLSPTTVLKQQKGDCFEYSTLLCSLLIGVGYDAYVVHGYATRETCLADESREICPLLKKKEEKKEQKQQKVWKKYSVKPPKDLRSKFDLDQEARRKADEEGKEAKRRKEAEDRQAELEKPPVDPLYGLRIHSWVLILSGKREVPESFFIEPLTGLSHPVNSPSYLGIEAVWNNMNYWVNMQDCSEGVKGLNYDLSDCTSWEYMFPNTDKPLLTIPEAEPDFRDIYEDEEEEEEVEKHLDMPSSWVESIKLSLTDFQRRCPQGKKTKLYKRAKLEKYAPYLMKDGLISRLSVYENNELTELTLRKEFFAHRRDKLHIKAHNHQTGWITEDFHHGRDRGLKEHQYKASAPGPNNERTMTFYHEARDDGLLRRSETPTEMTEEFVDRDDFMYYKHVMFSKRPKKFGPQDGTTGASSKRTILKMVQKFHPNKSKPANEDVAELVFLVSEDKFKMTYHTEDRRISSSTREFIKPQNWDEKGTTLSLSADMHHTYQVDPNSKPKKQVALYQTLLDLLKAEYQCKDQVRESEQEVCEIINDRTREEFAFELDIAVYDTERNEKTKKHRKELERQQMEEKMRKQEMEIDYLAPFLAKLGDPERITKSQAYQLKEQCLADVKQRLIDMANLIQERFEKETQGLQKKQAWYQAHQVQMQKEDEIEYLNYCSEAMFRIHILENRLNRHKETAPHKYMVLEQRLRTDPRMQEYF